MIRHSVITKGRGFIFPADAHSQYQGLRCKALTTIKVKGEVREVVCNRLIVKPNSDGEIAGEFRCIRCKQTLEVKITDAPWSQRSQC